MNCTKRFALLELLMVFMTIALLSLLTFQSQAIELTQETRLTTATNLPAIVTTGAVSNQTSVVVIEQGKGLAVQWEFNVSSGTSNAVLQVFPSVDGTNFSTTAWEVSGNAAGTSNRRLTKNWTAAELTGYRALNVGGITNQNAGTLTNKGVFIGRPNF